MMEGDKVVIGDPPVPPPSTKKNPGCQELIDKLAKDFQRFYDLTIVL